MKENGDRTMTTGVGNMESDPGEQCIVAELEADWNEPTCEWELRIR